MSKKYNKSKWKAIRSRVLRRDHYECQDSRRYGKCVEATTVHHIYPVEFYPELMYEQWNLISLSPEAHNKMHERKTHAITNTGKEWQQRKRQDYLDWCERTGNEPKFFK